MLHPRTNSTAEGQSSIMIIVNPRKLEHGFRTISAVIPYTLPYKQEENVVPSFWLVLYWAPVGPDMQHQLKKVLGTVAGEYLPNHNRYNS